MDVYDSIIHQESASGSSDANAWLQRLANVSEVLRVWVSSCLNGTNRALVAAGQMSLTNGIGNRDTENASAQLYRAVSSGGLLAQIDSYKASLEGCVGGNTDEIAKITSSLLETENIIRRFFFELLG